MNFLSHIIQNNFTDINKKPTKRKSSIKNTPKEKPPIEQPQTPQTPQPFQYPPALFEKQYIYLDLDSSKYDIVKRALTNAHATVTDFRKIADVIISENRVVKREQSNTRGSKLNRLPNQTVVHLNQIQWVFDSHFSLPDNAIISAIPSLSTPSIPEAEIYRSKKANSKLIVVADSLSRFRPNYMPFPHQLKLYFFDRKIKGYTMCPFHPIPADPERAIKEVLSQIHNPKNENCQIGPHGNGFCEICQMPFDDPNEHRISRDHLRFNTAEKWAEFDQLADAINALSPPVSEII